MTVRVIKLNSGIKVGEQISIGSYYGSEGRWVEDKLQANGYTINRGFGPDLLQMGIEVKTRLETSGSGHTMACMKMQDIMQTNWQDSNIFAKTQKQYRVYYNEDRVVISEEVYDFTDPYIQDRLEEAYDFGKFYFLINQKNPGDYIRHPDGWAYFEKPKNQKTDWYQFRITPGHMKHIETVAKQPKLFEY